MKRDLPAYVYRKGRKGYLYFCRGGATTRIHDEPGSDAFWRTYARLLGGQDTTPKRTFKRLIASYERSDAFAKIKPVTRQRYGFDLAWIERNAGNMDPATFKAHHIYRMLDALRDTPTTANHRLTMMRVLFDHAAKIGWCETNPAREVRRLRFDKRKRQPWPQDAIDAFRATAEGRTLLIFELLLGTGQRVADVLSMQWAHIEGDGINVRQSKTGTEIWVPFTPRLAGMLAETPRQSLYIVHREDGRPLGYDMAQKGIMAVRRAIGAEDYDIHSLRYAAASEIAALPGMTAEHVRAITGHESANMVSLYSKKAAQRARAKEVQALRNERGTNRETGNNV